jgi:crotonobetainyl-CoA:carnitine CoA-transferase CaiB-like acyl-CoA transferase
MGAGPEDAPRLLVEPLSDPAAALHGLVALLAALHARERTGRGRHLDLSQAECALHMVGDALALASAGHEAAPHAARDDAQPVRSVDDLLAWDHLHARNASYRLRTPDGGTVTHLRTPLLMDGLAARHAPAPARGEGGEAMARAWLWDGSAGSVPERA